MLTWIRNRLRAWLSDPVDVRFSHKLPPSKPNRAYRMIGPATEVFADLPLGTELTTDELQVLYESYIEKGKPLTIRDTREILHIHRNYPRAGSEL